MEPCLRKTSIESFLRLFSWFFDLQGDEGEDYDLFPFAKKSLPAYPCLDSFDFPSDQSLSDRVWARTLTPQLLRVAAPGESTTEFKHKMVIYSPQLVACQFELAQAIPMPNPLTTDEPFVHYKTKDVKEVARCKAEEAQRFECYQRVSHLKRFFLTTSSFSAWWSNYFTSQCPSLAHALVILGFDLVLTNVNLDPVQSSPINVKTKGMHLQEIIAFEKFYKVKSNVKWIRPTFYDALEVWKRKKEAHLDRCLKKYFSARDRNPFVERDNLMKPFTYPPFPNAPFGLADSFPDPPRGPLSSDYIPNYSKTRHVTICSHKWCQQRDYLVQGRTTIERYPPDAKPVRIIGTTSEPTHRRKDVTSEGESQDKPKKEKKSKKSSGRSKKRAASDIEGEVPVLRTSSKKQTASDTGAEIPHPKAKKLKVKTTKREKALVGSEEEKTQKKEHSISSPQSDTIGAEGIEASKATLKVSKLPKLLRVSKLPRLQILIYPKLRRQKDPSWPVIGRLSRIQLPIQLSQQQLLKPREARPGMLPELSY
ncbi:hypothetical protein PIB30_009451 [Stylosanthes scabra]|uniref:Uncharacterized protein n=1 Tax=Stylosanthes scabra TaxID=79078 RepID=A0ABU6X5Y4_9FABA|nr:hypothetical protein [Stylosanthes scabra]